MEELRASADCEMAFKCEAAFYHGQMAAMQGLKTLLDQCGTGLPEFDAMMSTATNRVNEEMAATCGG